MSAQHKPWGMTKVITASSAGTAFEWYDFFIFGSLAQVISKVFFTGLDPTAGADRRAWACSPPASPSARWARSCSG